MLTKIAARCLSGLLATSALFACATHAAERYPNKPVRLIVPFPPGGGNDIAARTIGQKLNNALGQSFVVDNRPGAASMIGTEIVAKAVADGYTIILAASSHTINVLLYAKPRYDPVADFAPITLIATAPMALLAHPSFSANTLKDLLAMPGAQTEKFAMGSSGQGTGPHMTYEWLRVKTGLTLNHVPYKGGGPALSDAAGGQIPLVFSSLPAAMAFVTSKRLKVLGVTSAQREPVVPAVPTFQEAGVKDFVSLQWWGVLAPARTPRDVVALLNREIAKALAAPDVKERFASIALEAAPSTPEAFRALLESEVGRWKDVLKQVNIQLD